MSDLVLQEYMKLFASLYRELESSTKTNTKLSALVSYLKSAHDSDKLWAIALFTKRRPKRTIKTSQLRAWAAEMSGLPEWLFEESYHIVGDLAETISLTLPKPSKEVELRLSEWIDLIIQQKDQTEDQKKKFVLDAWDSLRRDERFLFNKIITGGFRLGVSQKMMTKAIAKVIQEDENKVAHRLMGNWSPLTTTYEALIVNADWASDISRPYPFYLAYAIDDEISWLGKPELWQAEWKWDGIRAQLIKREHQLFLWTRGEELVTDKYPEFRKLAELEVDNFVIDGELLVIREGDIRPFNELQKRIGRKTISKKLLLEYPVAIRAYDLMELNKEDVRQLALNERRVKLKNLVREISINDDTLISFSEDLPFSSWDELSDLRSTARSLKAEGVMLKLKSGTYQSGRRRGEWWKWKLDPYTIDAVMLYAQRGHGRRSNLFTDFTFAVWNEDGSLVPFAKAYSGLTDLEFSEVTRFVNRNTIERFGPVRSVTPALVFEIAFEGINESKRHKSGVALRFPRIKRWRRDKKAEDANTLKELKSLLTTMS